MNDNEFGLTQAEKNEILEKYVRPVMERILMEHIAHDIYGAYSPKPFAWIGGETYHRRGSLLPKGSLYHEITGDTIMVTSDAEPESIWGGFGGGHGGFLAMLESGNMGAWSRATGRGLPRPALSQAQSEVDKSSELEAAVHRGIDEILMKRR